LRTFKTFLNSYSSVFNWKSKDIWVYHSYLGSFGWNSSIRVLFLPRIDFLIHMFLFFGIFRIFFTLGNSSFFGYLIFYVKVLHHFLIFLISSHLKIYAGVPSFEFLFLKSNLETPWKALSNFHLRVGWITVFNNSLLFLGSHIYYFYGICYLRLVFFLRSITTYFSSFISNYPLTYFKLFLRLILFINKKTIYISINSNLAFIIY